MRKVDESVTFATLKLLESSAAIKTCSWRSQSAKVMLNHPQIHSTGSSWDAKESSVFPCLTANSDCLSLVCRRNFMKSRNELKSFGVFANSIICCSRDAFCVSKSNDSAIDV